MNKTVVRSWPHQPHSFQQPCYVYVYSAKFLTFGPVNMLVCPYGPVTLMVAS